MSEISEAQLSANRANAQLSRGPLTEAGKRRSSVNAIRHGLSGRTVLLPGEDITRYQSFCLQLMTELDPKNPLESELAQTIIDQQWRLNRIRAVEDGLFALLQFSSSDSDSDSAADAILATAQAFRQNSRDFINLTIYEQRIQRLQREALKQLKELQAQRKAQEQAQLEEAVRVHKLHEMLGRQWDPRENGFVYSSDEISRAAARRALVRRSNLAENVNYKLDSFLFIAGDYTENPQKPVA